MDFVFHSLSSRIRIGMRINFTFADFTNCEDLLNVGELRTYKCVCEMRVPLCQAHRFHFSFVTLNPFSLLLFPDARPALRCTYTRVFLCLYIGCTYVEAFVTNSYTVFTFSVALTLNTGSRNLRLV